MGQITADRSAIADLRVRNVRQGVRKQRAGRQEGAIPLEIAVAGQRADPNRLPARQRDAGQLIETINIDQHVRPCQAEIHRRNQALAAGEKPGVVAIFGLERKRVVQRRGGNVFEWSRLHMARSGEASASAWKHGNKVSAVQRCKSKAGGAKGSTNCIECQRKPAHYSLGMHKQWARQRLRLLPNSRSWHCLSRACQLSARRRSGIARTTTCHSLLPSVQPPIRLPDRYRGGWSSTRRISL